MIVFLDIDECKVRIYTDNGLQEVSFQNMEVLKQFLKNKKDIIYVTDFVPTTGAEVINTVAALLEDSPEVLTKKINEPLFLHSTTKSFVRIEKLNLTFGSAKDCVPLKKLQEDYGEDVLETDPILKKLVESGKLEVITLSQVQKLQKQLDAQQAKKDKALDSILVDGPVDKYMEDGVDDDSGHADAIEIDLDKGGSFGSKTNEGTLLPDDF